MPAVTAPRIRFERWLRGGGLAILGLLVVLLLGLWLYVRQVERRRPSPLLKITAGSIDTTRARVARILMEQLATREIHTLYTEIVGSEAALDAIERGQIDLALIQGGLKLRERTRVREIASLYVEPLHLAVKQGSYPRVSQNLATLEGATVNLGGPTTGTIRLAAAVMNFAGLAPGEPGQKGTYQPVYLDSASLIKAIRQNPAFAPDATFLVSTQPSSTIDELVNKYGYRLVDLPFAKAFRLGALKEPEPFHAGEPAEVDNQSVEPALSVEAQLSGEIQREYVYDTIVPPFTYRLNEPVPARPISTLGTRLLIVGRDDLDPHLVGRVLDTVFNSRFIHVSDPPLDLSLLGLPNEYAAHEGTLRFRNRNKPLITGDIVDLAEKWVSMAGVTAGGLFFFWQWYNRRARMRQERGFEFYILKVAEIERQAVALELSAELDLSRLIDLQRRLAQIKQEALLKLASGELDRDELMNGFLSHVSDSRDYLARLILHQRENVEQAAEARGLSPRSLWSENLEPPRSASESASAEHDPAAG